MNKLEQLVDRYPDQNFTIAVGFDDAVVGFSSTDNRLIYNIEEMVQVLITRDGMEYEEALEYLYYNTIDAYIGEDTPIYMHTI
jgi:hypothetical protein